MSDASAPAPAQQPRRAYRFPLLLITLALLLTGGTALGLYLHYLDRVEAADAAVREALSEADRLDPGWRLEELEARRATVPDNENSALQVRRAKKLIPPKWAAGEPFSELFRDFEDSGPERQLNAEQLKALRAALARAAPALAEADRMKDMPRGRFPLVYNPDWIFAHQHVQEPRDVGDLLEQQALLQIHEGAADAALGSCRGILNCGRALGDEPSLLALVVRSELRSVACGSAERTLAQGQPSDNALLVVQRLFEDEETMPLMLIAVRGDRAGWDRMMEAIVTGKLPPELPYAFGGPRMGKSRREATEVALLHSVVGLKHQRAAFLRYMNQAVEIAKLPDAEQAKRWEELEAGLSKQPPVVRTIVPAMGKVAAAYRRALAALRCGIAAIAAERFRLARGAWPVTPAELTAAGYLRAWPADPYDGAPLRYKRLKDGVVIYALGDDGKDNGGKLRHGPGEEPAGMEGLDIGFRLWDVSHRRQPPLPPRPARPDPGDGPDDPPDAKEP
jgi:hypothetical protein